MNGVEVYIGLGSNLADPLRQLARAVVELASLPDTSLIAQSAFYSSRPVGPQDQPDFINGAVRLNTSLAPLALLDHLQRIENTHGRLRNQHWGPRTLDLDLLLYGDRPVQNERLMVPHPELANRDFVLQPLLELNPELVLPDGRTLAVLRHQCPNNGLKRLEPATNASPP
ncbi:2-amino-4-hydroxy-6-hydroxymethyldihydropteridine diphosphokinase [Marinobacter changyiensis]|uniref:2-amino-4-hydroxy-6- hydroxymethyldihydropteridine diphosphokinase n=1 Tax=Marinobacter changyiensis TaxID=2604091 RepID=UPI001264F6F7|nr:2-amino-4-hydroxy-6-hydroxymethyldihydropteridine diphosphokinase [Marinobacter changyiensis]